MWLLNARAGVPRGELDAEFKPGCTLENVLILLIGLMLLFVLIPSICCSPFDLDGVLKNLIEMKRKLGIIVYNDYIAQFYDKDRIKRHITVSGSYILALDWLVLFDYL